MTRLPAFLLTIAGLVAVTTGALAAWETETGVATPSYAVTQPETTTLNVDSLVLMCEPSGDDSGENQQENGEAGHGDVLSQAHRAYSGRGPPRMIHIKGIVGGCRQDGLGFRRN